MVGSRDGPRDDLYGGPTETSPKIVDDTRGTTRWVGRTSGGAPVCTADTCAAWNGCSVSI
ncbi:MAG: hypothetical protein EA388_04985 [Nitriliruptor sp.]|nr:MAG: hypothetical protein EA388_04985 [Nitriliruptor sp.]